MTLETGIGQKMEMQIVLVSLNILFNNRFLRERGIVFTLKMEYQVFLCIFQKNSAMATLGMKEMGKFLPCWLSQFSFSNLRQPRG